MQHHNQLFLSVFCILFYNLIFRPVINKVVDRRSSALIGSGKFFTEFGRGVDIDADFCILRQSPFSNGQQDIGDCIEPEVGIDLFPSIGSFVAEDGGRTGYLDTSHTGVDATLKGPGSISSNHAAIHDKFCVAD
ncbi:Uncharacterised protein [uncultured Flavonifractor sp.]|nr:Uncharacterised protein [uncultured Flavonifractor sp.]